MTWVSGKIIFANTWKDSRSRVYEIDPGTMEVTRSFDMPTGAVHTSGLAWDGQYLWAVDYRSHRAYCIDLEPSLNKGVVELLGSFETGLKGTSACCIIPWQGEEYLAISDFMNSKETIFVLRHAALEAGHAEGFVHFRYRNEGFSQGLEYVDGYLYESENKLGRDVVNKLDLKLLLEYRRSRKATVTQYSAPGRGVEDLAWSGNALWTSDEVVFRFFKGVGFA
jgi:glutamine cyclotransferase